MGDPLTAVVTGLTCGAPDGELLALHQLTELLMGPAGADGRALAVTLPHVLSLLTRRSAEEEDDDADDGSGGGGASPSSSSSSSALPLLCLRVLATFADVEPVSATRALARPTALAALRAPLAHFVDVDAANAAVLLGATVARAGFAPAVLRSGFLGAAVTVADALPPATRRRVFTTAAACVEGGGNGGELDRRDVALLLDVTPALLAEVDRLTAEAGAAEARGGGASDALPLDDAAASLAAARAVGRLLSNVSGLVMGLAAREQAGSGGDGTAAAAAAATAVSLHVPAAGAARRLMPRTAAATTAPAALPASSSTLQPPPPLPAWPIQALQHLVALGAPRSLARLLAVHAAGGGGAADRAAPPRPPLLGHAALRACVRSLARVLLLLPSQRRSLAVECGLVRTAQRLAVHAAGLCGAPRAALRWAAVGSDVASAAVGGGRLGGAVGDTGDDAEEEEGGDEGRGQEGEAEGVGGRAATAPPATTPAAASSGVGSGGGDAGGGGSAEMDAVAAAAGGGGGGGGAAGLTAKQAAGRLEDAVALLQLCATSVTSV